MTSREFMNEIKGAIIAMNQDTRKMVDKVISDLEVLEILKKNAETTKGNYVTKDVLIKMSNFNEDKVKVMRWLNE